MRRQLYTKELLPKCRKFIKCLEEILPKVKQHCSVIQSMLIDEYFSRFVDKFLMVEHRFKMAPENYDAKTARKIYSMSDDDAVFIKKGARETVFGYRPSFAFSASVNKFCVTCATFLNQQRRNNDLGRLTWVKWESSKGTEVSLR